MSIGDAIRRAKTLVVHVVVAATALWVAGCAVATSSRTIALTFGDQPSVTLGTDPTEFTIAQVAARLIHDRFGLPFPADTTVYLYGNLATFAEGLARDGGIESDDAGQRARFAVGAASPRGIFLRADRLAFLPLVERVSVIAHELTHVSQSEMRRGGRSIAAQWIREGHADWVKFRVLESLGLRTYENSRADVGRAVLRSSPPIRRFPNLVDLTRADQWTEARNRFGSAATYGQAFLAINYLVEGYGIERLHEFLRRFALDSDPREHWGAVFPISFSAFVQEFRLRLEASAISVTESTGWVVANSRDPG
jgi:hypothetical protein